MKSKLIKWLMTFSACTFALSIGTCAQLAPEAIARAIEPCDIINCEDPRFFDLTRILEADRPERAQTWGDGA